MIWRPVYIRLRRYSRRRIDDAIPRLRICFVFHEEADEEEEEEKEKEKEEEEEEEEEEDPFARGVASRR